MRNSSGQVRSSPTRPFLSVSSITRIMYLWVETRLTDEGLGFIEEGLESKEDWNYKLNINILGNFSEHNQIHKYFSLHCHAENTFYNNIIIRKTNRLFY